MIPLGAFAYSSPGDSNVPMRDGPPSFWKKRRNKSRASAQHDTARNPQHIGVAIRNTAAHIQPGDHTALRVAHPRPATYIGIGGAMPRLTKPARGAAFSISGPFDARHVGGVSIPAVVPAMLERSLSVFPQTKNATLNSTTTATATDVTGTHLAMEPDEAPTHINMSLNTNAQAPKRSNSLADMVRRPSLRLKTSMQRLRLKGSRQSPDRVGRDQEREMPESIPVPHLELELELELKVEDGVRSKRKTTPHAQAYRDLLAMDDFDIDVPNYKINNMKLEVDSTYPSTNTSYLDKNKRAKSKPKRVNSGNSSDMAIPSNKCKPLPPGHTHVDPGTAITFAGDDDQRPLGFQEILKVKSFEERMALYKKTREFWATADHGLEDWVFGAKIWRDFRLD